jgi:hypothetical protein
LAFATDVAMTPAAMNAAPSTSAFVITATSHVVWDDSQPPDVLPWLASRKSRKFMGRQDQLAVIAAGQALRDAGLHDTATPGAALDALGLYLTVGHIPFERDDIDAIAARSVGADGAFDITRFAAEGIAQVNPLLTFRCLPNMPAFHISQNFGLTGAYEVAYPGTAQAAQSLAHALDDLDAGRVEMALVGGVADQRNFLVQFFFDRDAGRCALPRRDEAAMVLIESRDAVYRRGAVVLGSVEAIDVRPAHAAQTPPRDAHASMHDVAAPALFAWLHREAHAHEHEHVNAHEHERSTRSFTATSLELAAVHVQATFEGRGR